MTALSSKASFLVLAALGLCACGSSDESSPPTPWPPGCPEGHTVAGECVGVSSSPVCAENTCTAGVACDNIVTVTNDAELTNAASSATAGTCIAVAPGNYGD